MTRAFCKHLLHDTFTSLLLLGDAPSGSHDPNAGDTCLDMFKSILNIAKEADSTLLSCYGNTKQLMASAIDSGVYGVVTMTTMPVLLVAWCSVLCCNGAG